MVAVLYGSDFLELSIATEEGKAGAYKDLAILD